MMDILSSFIINPSDNIVGSDLVSSLPNSLGLPSLFSGLLTKSLGPFSFTFLTLIPLGSGGSFGGNFLGSGQFHGLRSELFFEIFRTGLFHGLFFSLPFSIPMLICFRRYILDGFSLGNYAFAGTLLGHLSFLFCTIKGIRPIIHFWYPLEPILSLLGLALSLKVATDFFSQRRFVFDGTLGSSEDSSAYAMNPWPQMPEISWVMDRSNRSWLQKPAKLIPDLTSKIPPIFLDVMTVTKNIFFLVLAIIQTGLLSKWFKPVRIPFQKFQNFCQKNLGPSIFAFQFFLMWLNPASASTLNLIFFEHGIGVPLSPTAPLFLLYTLGFIFAAGALSTLILFVISQLAGRNFIGLFSSPLGTNSDQFTWFKRAGRLIQFDETLAQNRFKIFNKFFAFLIIGCVVQGGLNYTWRLFLQYPLEMIHWDFFTTLTKNFPLLRGSVEGPGMGPGPTSINAPPNQQQGEGQDRSLQVILEQQLAKEIEVIDLQMLPFIQEIYKLTFIELAEPGVQLTDKLTTELNTLKAKKEFYLRDYEAVTQNSLSEKKMKALMKKLNSNAPQETSSRGTAGKSQEVSGAAVEMGSGSTESNPWNGLGLTLPISESDDMKLASSFFMPDSDQRSYQRSWPGKRRQNSNSVAGVNKKNRVSLETYWAHVTENKDFLDPNSADVTERTAKGPGKVIKKENPIEPEEALPTSGGPGPAAGPVGAGGLPGNRTEGVPSGPSPLNFFGRREFPPYDTSIRNREKNLPVERHLAIERINARRGLMGRPPLENEERENAIFKYHTFFMNQIDRAVEDLKMKLVTPPDLYREENDILALQKLHENFLKQKARESEYQNSVINPNRGTSAVTSNSKSLGSVPRHHRDFFTKSRSITNTTKGFSKSSYVRDLFDPNLQEAYSNYSHDDLLLEKIIAAPGMGPTFQKK